MKMQHHKNTPVSYKSVQALFVHPSQGKGSLRPLKNVKNPPYKGWCVTCLETGDLQCLGEERNTSGLVSPPLPQNAKCPSCLFFEARSKPRKMLDSFMLDPLAAVCGQGFEAWTDYVLSFSPFFIQSYPFFLMQHN